MDNKLFYKNENSTLVYVIDKDYRIIYSNSELKDLYPSFEEGDLCYNALYKNNAPCNFCPLNGNNNSVFLNTALNCITQIKSANIEWPCCGECRLLMVDKAPDNIAFSKPVSNMPANRTEQHADRSSDTLHETEQERTFLNEILHGIENDEFTFFLQPQCNMETKKIVSAEALSRWNHPERGIVSPGEYIPILEKHNVVTTLDLYIWRKVFEWQSKRLSNNEQLIPISVNVSRIDFQAIDVPETFKDLSAEFDVSPFFVEIEITESAYGENNSFIQKSISKLQSYGFRILMDDFGSGYSSINMLKTTNIDMIKLDMQLIETNEDNLEKTLEILRSFKNMTYKLKLPNIVEGVETEEQCQMLLEINYHYGQGYLFYRPVPVSEFEKLLNDENNLDLQGIRLRYNQNAQMLGIWNEINVQEVMRSLPGGFFIYKDDDKKTLVYASDLTPPLYGCSSMTEFKKHVKNSFIGMVHPDDYERVNAEIYSQISSSDADLDYVRYRIIKKDGTVSWVDDYGHLMHTDELGDLFYVFIAESN